MSAPLPVHTARPAPRRAAGDSRPMRVMLLCSAFNGLSQRAWVELVDAGLEVQVQIAGDAVAVRAAVSAMGPDLVLCPFLRERVPADVWKAWPTVIIHPGPTGDRGPSSLDWALMDAEGVWGVTAVQAVEEMDAGPIWGTRTFPIDGPPRKSDLYNGAVTDAAVQLIHEVVAKAGDPDFVPDPLDYARPDVTGRLRAAVRRADRAVNWSDETRHILRKIRAADGSPGVRTELCGLPVAVFDAYESQGVGGPAHRPGAVISRGHGAVQVATGDGSLWIGQLQDVTDPFTSGLKLPATSVLDGRLHHVPEALPGAAPREIHYHRDGAVGVLSFDFYNGAMSTRQCRRLELALQHATEQDTRVLLLRGGPTFSNGIHLGVIEAANDPGAEAWANIVAIDDVCRQIISCVDQIVVCSVGGNAGAGGVMLALGADRVVLRDGVVLNPHYRTMGLYGSEYWTYVLPRRVGQHVARTMTRACDPVGTAQALRTRLADHVVRGDRTAFDTAMIRYARQLAERADYPNLLADKRNSREADEECRPLHAYRSAELDRMWSDIVHDANDFASARRMFLHKGRPQRSTAITA
ncbi:MAG: enoyl-CoA hydratase-related protein [Lapillicoccus sp.]